MLSFERQACGRWPCTAALGTTQNRLLWNRARPGIGRPHRIPICRSGQAPCTRPVPGGPGAVLLRAQQGAGRISTTRVARPARGLAPQRGGCMRRRALPSASNHPAICSRRDGAATRRLQQRAFYYLQHPRAHAHAPTPTSSSSASRTARRAMGGRRGLGWWRPGMQAEGAWGYGDWPRGVYGRPRLLLRLALVGRIWGCSLSRKPGFTRGSWALYSPSGGAGHHHSGLVGWIQGRLGPVAPCPAPCIGTPARIHNLPRPGCSSKLWCKTN